MLLRFAEISATFASEIPVTPCDMWQEQHRSGKDFVPVRWIRLTCHKLSTAVNTVEAYNSVNGGSNVALPEHVGKYPGIQWSLTKTYKNFTPCLDSNLRSLGPVGCSTCAPVTQESFRGFAASWDWTWGKESDHISQPCFICFGICKDPHGR